MAAMQMPADADVLGVPDSAKNEKGLTIKDLMAGLENWQPGRTKLLFECHIT